MTQMTPGHGDRQFDPLIFALVHQAVSKIVNNPDATT
jgi:hypothetical protein